MSRVSDRLYSRSAFRPSVYSTGLQEVQPYAVEWPEGVEYGAFGELKTPGDYMYWLLSGGTFDPSGGTITTPSGERKEAEEVAVEEQREEWNHHVDDEELAAELKSLATGEYVDPHPPEAPWYKRWYVWTGVGVVVVGGGAFAYSRVKKGKKKNKILVVGP